MNSVTRELAQWIAQTGTGDLSERVHREGIRSVLNLVGALIGGSDHAAVAILREVTDDSALIYGAASHVLDFDDTDLATVIHPAGPVVASLLALARETGITGETFLLAAVIGIEVSCRVADAISPTHYDRGWHSSASCGVVGAAAACSRALELSCAQTRHALGIATCQSAGLRAMFGSMSKAFQVGKAGANGLLAARLAAAGFTSHVDALDAERGFVFTACDAPAPSRITADLGRTWRILDNTYKPYPCGIVLHPLIDACLRLHREHGTATITSISARVHPLALELTGKTAPRNGLEAKFSYTHAAAYATLHGAADLAAFSDEAAGDPVVVALRKHVRAKADADLAKDAAVVNAQTAAGESIDVAIKHAVGSRANPLSDRALDEKVRGLSRPILGAAAAADLIAFVRDLSEQANLDALIAWASPWVNADA